MKLEDLKNGSVVRVKIGLDRTVSVYRYRLDIDGELVKEYLNDSGEWVLLRELQEILKISEVFFETEDLMSLH